MEDVIAAVIVVAAGVVIALAAASWLLGLWSGVQEEFMIRPMVYVRQYGTGLSGGSVPELVLVVDNKGNAGLKILRVELQVAGGSYVNMSVFEVPPQSEVTITINDWDVVGSPAPIDRGDNVRVIVYTDKVDRLFFDIVAS